MQVEPRPDASRAQAPPTRAMVVSPGPRETAAASVARPSFLQRLTQFPARPLVSVVPFAPERLSISQEVFTPPPQMPAIKSARTEEPPDDPPDAAAATPSSGPGISGKFFAAMRIRRAFVKHAQSGRILSRSKKESEQQANADRHLKVLSRYKIRRYTDAEGAENERLRLKRSYGCMMVNPDNTAYRVWQLVTLLLICYQSVVLPYSMAFGVNTSNTIDTITSAVFALDIAIQFNTPVAPLDGEGEYVTNRWDIAKQYVRGWLFFDLLACIPFDYVLQWVGNIDTRTSGGSNFNVLGLLKALRIPRLLRLVRLVRIIKIFRLRPEIRRWMQYSREANLLRLVRLVIFFLIINHFLACIWWGAVASDATTSPDIDQGALHRYLVSYYLVMQVVMGQNIILNDDMEYGFCIIVMVFGAVLMAVVFGNVGMLIANYYDNQSRYQKKMEWLFATMTRMQLPAELQNRINEYYVAMWDRHGTLDGAVTAFIPELSRNLAYEVELFLRMDMINRAPIFQNCSAKVVQELVMELELQVFMPGDYIVVRGEVGNDMYFVQSGVCEVTKEAVPPPQQSFTQTWNGPQDNSSSTEIVLKRLGQGDYFGEIALLMNCKRTANVRAQEFSELCALTRQTFENISLRYLEDRSIIEKFIMDKYDPGMLQAALKQSQEASMRSVAQPSRSSFAHKASPRQSEGDTGVVLRRIEERLQRVEEQLMRDAKERRDSEMRHSQAEAERRSKVSEDSINSRVASRQASSHMGANFVLFEPERVSQRHLLEPPQRRSANAAPIAETSAQAMGAMSASTSFLPPIQGEAAGSTLVRSDSSKRRGWNMPLERTKSGSWRNARREGSLGSMRLRGLVKPGAAHAPYQRTSTHALSIPSNIAGDTAVLVPQDLLMKEPPLRGEVRLPRADSTMSSSKVQDALTSDTLDELATTLSQFERENDNSAMASSEAIAQQQGPIG